MITVEEKLSAFTKLVLEKAHREYEKKLREITEENNKRIIEYKKELEKRSEKIIDDMIARGKLEKNKLISRAKIEKKRSILGKKEELIQKTIENITKMAEQFTYKEEYQKYMENSIENTFADLKGRETIILYIRERDMEKIQDYLYEEGNKIGFSQNQINLLPAKNNIIGGIIAIDENRTFKIDYSLKTLIEDKKSMIGSILNEGLIESNGN